MTKRELVEIFRRQYGYEPEGEELNLLMDEYGLEHDEEYGYWNRQQRQQGSRIYDLNSGTHTSNNSNAASDLIQEVKDIFEEISGLAGKSINNTEHNENLDEFSHMLMVFVIKSALYFLLKSAYSKGYDAVNI